MKPLNSYSSSETGRLLLRRTGLFPLGEFHGRAVLVGAVDGVPYLLPQSRTSSGNRAAMAGAWIGALILTPGLSLLASLFLGGTPSVGAVLLVICVAAFPVAAVVELGAVRQRLELERSRLDPRALLDLQERSRGQGRILALFAPAHLALLVVLSSLAASTGRANYMVGAAFALGFIPMSVYAARAAKHRRQWVRRWLASVQPS